MYSPYNNHFVLTLLRRRFPMVVGEWSLALGGRGKAALPASQVPRHRFLVFLVGVLKHPIDGDIMIYSGDAMGI